jgi:hypothetical protein
MPSVTALLLVTEAHESLVAGAGVGGPARYARSCAPPSSSRVGPHLDDGVAVGLRALKVLEQIDAIFTNARRAALRPRWTTLAKEYERPSLRATWNRARMEQKNARKFAPGSPDDELTHYGRG